MKTYRPFSFIFTIAAISLSFTILYNNAAGQSGQPKMLASIDFDPQVDGYGFENPGNEHRWQNDLDVSDLISMFGVAPVCVTGNSLSNCVIKRPAENWRIKILQAMDGGHCEGMAVTAFMFFEEREFKNRWKLPANFQKDAEAVFDLKFSYQSVQNYIAYFWATQDFNEIHRAREAGIKSGPAGMVKSIINGLNTEGGDLYTLGICKYVNGDYKDCHAVTPFAVEDAGNNYRIHLYDNNSPGKTRYMTVEKAGRQTWRYNAAPNPNTEEELYVGDISTKSMHIAPNSVRLYGKKYRAPFATNRENSASQSASGSSGGERVEFLVNDDAEMLVTTGDGKRIGYDGVKKQTLNEVPDADIVYLGTSKSDNLPPVLKLPFQPNAKPFTITLSGRNLTQESRPDLVYTGPGFSVGFDGIRLDPKESLTITISPDGKNISFTASDDGETPEMYFSFNNENGESYLFEVDGIELAAGKTLFGEFDLKNGKIRFKDNDGRKDKYDIDFERVLASGKVQKYETNDIDFSDDDDYEMDFGSWDGESDMCFRSDDDEDEDFDSEECHLEPFEDNDSGKLHDPGDDEDSDVIDDLNGANQKSLILPVLFKYSF